jgi:hypothetical protein
MSQDLREAAMASGIGRGESLEGSRHLFGVGQGQGRQRILGRGVFRSVGWEWFPAEDIAAFIGIGDGIELGICVEVFEGAPENSVAENPAGADGA